MTAFAEAGLVFDSHLRTVALGTAGLGAVTGLVGTFAVIRRQSLQGDAVSHAALPGLALAFLFGFRSPALLLIGAAVSGWVAMALVGGIVRRSRIPFDTALGGTLAVFFGLGVAVLSWVLRYVPDASTHGLDRYLFGRAAELRGGDLWVIGAGGAGIALTVALFWRDFKLVSFDPAFAAALGRPVLLLDLLLTALVVVAVVIGLQAVGVVLMSTLLVAPAVAARQWTDRLDRLAALAAAIGAAAGAAGVILSHPVRLPTGPTIVLCATAVAALSILFAPGRGVVWRLWPRPAGDPGGPA